MSASPPGQPIQPAVRERIRHALLSWYRKGHRDLPWRRRTDPYAIWISEIMLQQTRVETVTDYFERFMARFPTVQALSEGPLDDVLTLWSGLGYYTRARNLHLAAREVMTRHEGELPGDEEGLRSLPGIGEYTAGAILSVAFGKQAALVDGNVIRVLSRLFAISDPLEASATKRRYWQLARALVPPAGTPERNDPGDFNQAMMELGATVCVPKRPSCLLCPLAEICAARLLGEQERFPPRKAERQVPLVEIVTLMVKDGKEVLLLRRLDVGLWGGLWEPPTLGKEGEPDESALLRLCAERLGFAPGKRLLGRLSPLPAFEHVLTHRHMRFSPYLLPIARGELPAMRLDGGYTEARWVDPSDPIALGLSAWVSGLLGRMRGEDGKRTG